MLYAFISRDLFRKFNEIINNNNSRDVVNVDDDDDDGVFDEIFLPS